MDGERWENGHEDYGEAEASLDSSVVDCDSCETLLFVIFHEHGSGGVKPKTRPCRLIFAVVLWLISIRRKLISYWNSLLRTENNTRAQRR
jgi:hypothetical protein